MWGRGRARPGLKGCPGFLHRGILGNERRGRQAVRLPLCCRGWDIGILRSGAPCSTVPELTMNGATKRSCPGQRGTLFYIPQALVAGPVRGD